MQELRILHNKNTLLARFSCRSFQYEAAAVNP